MDAFFQKLNTLSSREDLVEAIETGRQNSPSSSSCSMIRASNDHESLISSLTSDLADLFHPLDSIESLGLSDWRAHRFRRPAVHPLQTPARRSGHHESGS